ncbi:P-loop containing nucleoside triphosphate hydrolase protein [Blastocladiella britannica]|nr:P-loop containing nucleoside triphosphate hydrolase protein [Blastocladiella britannica]
MANALSNAISSIAPFDEYLFAAWILRYILLALLVLTAFGVHPLTRTTPARVAAAAAATAAAAARNVETGRPTALGHGGGRGGHHGGGGGGYAPEISNESWLKGASKKIKTLVPFMWPDKRPALQLCVSLALACLVIGRFTVVLVPLQYKIIINSLSVGVFPTKAIFLFVAFRFLQSGFLSNAQSLLWLPVGQYTTRNLSVRMFKHMHSLSLRWHVNRKTGEVLRVLDRGTASIVSLLQMLLFTLFPVIVDITVAIAYFVIEFDVYFGVIVVVTMTSYIFATVVLTEWRTKFRREMIELDNKTSQIGVDSLLNFETVKYYGAEQFEIQRYDKAIANYNKADFKSSGSMQLLNVMQGVITAVGLLVGSLLCAYRVSHKQLSIGDFVLFYQYIIQLYGPLNWMGTMYRVINQNFIDMEKMLKMFEEPLDVKDAPNAKPLVLAGGAVSFNQVQFGYSADQMVLQDLSFEIPAGHTVALVGPSGGGKSTTLKLLFRFFDVLGGSISIDGQDLREVTQTSLRQVIGVVPQDAVLFNDTLMSNIRFARPAATDEEVHAAARAAQIHDKILTFPNGYDTVVGERGLRLSGGERARIAIARTCLKSPSIILLDEATAALDSNTEHLIQEALAELCRGKTTMVIAHRLSTIMAADTICVIKDGTVAEHGTHDQLLALNGLYHELWHKQLRNEASAAAAEGAVAVLEAANVAEDAGATPTVASHPHHGGKGHHH